MAIDYAPMFGFSSVAAPAIFSVLYLCVLLWFIRQFAKHRAPVYKTLVFFCLIRLAAFTIRALLADSTSLSTTLGWFIADEILFGVGFFALLYSAYTLVLDRELIVGAPRADGVLPRLLRKRGLFRLALLAGIVLGLIGSGSSTYSSEAKSASTAIFLVLAVLQAILALSDVRAATAAVVQQSTLIGDRHAKILLCLISLLLVVREAFFTSVTLGNLALRKNELLWFELVALTEFLAVLCYAVPGLVPVEADETERDPLIAYA
ncbi:hypothetical protein C8R43DRAFT_86099 [Mycena crocata]|nr:hypothetical protein C8R43DRAFT_86099 [Mycena crocata]